jgi:DNA-binding transcriptional MocR family regulator
MTDYQPHASGPPTLMLGYANVPEPAIRSGVRELATAVRAAWARA